MEPEQHPNIMAQMVTEDSCCHNQNCVCVGLLNRKSERTRKKKDTATLHCTQLTLKNSFYLLEKLDL